MEVTKDGKLVGKVFPSLADVKSVGSEADFSGVMSLREMFDGCKKLQFFENDLSEVHQADGMFKDCTNLEHADISPSGVMAHLGHANEMFKNCEKLQTVGASDFPALTTANYMFKWCSSIKEVVVNMPNLVDANNMFENCKALETFEITERDCGVSILHMANEMFCGCCNLVSCKVDMSEVVQAKMAFFGCEKLTCVDTTLDKLHDGFGMFRYSGIKEAPSGYSEMTTAPYMFEGCKNLVRFKGNLPKLFDGKNMFAKCENLREFEAALDGLYFGEGMFEGCNLNKASVERIVDSVPHHTNGTHFIDIGYDSSEISDKDIEEYTEKMKAKGWNAMFIAKL